MKTFTPGEYLRAEDLNTALTDAKTEAKTETLSAVKNQLGNACRGVLTLQFGGGTKAEATIDFPPGIFTSPPIILHALNSANPVDGFLYCHTITTTSAKLGCYFTAARTGSVYIAWEAKGV